jgi:hypothetical protein
MTDDQERKYSDARREEEQALQKVLAIGSFISDVAHAINTKPYEMRVSGVNVELPPQVALPAGQPSLNAKDWPSAKQIAEALANLHTKRHEVSDLRRSLLPADQNIMTPPPSK